VCRQDGGTRAYRDVFTAGSGKPASDRAPATGSANEDLSR
jgi:hypothetical protein